LGSKDLNGPVVYGLQRLIRQALINKPNKKRPAGRPRQRRMDRVRDDLNGLINGASIEEDAGDRRVGEL